MRDYRAKDMDTGKWVYGMVYPNICIDLQLDIEYYYFFVIDYGDVRDSFLFSIRQATEMIDREGKWDHITGAFVKVYPESVGQFTGFKDVGGRRIYEGDIVIVPRGFDGKRYTRCNKCNATVKFKDGRYFVYEDDEPVWQIFDWCKLEKIGNKYDNPELLEQYYD